MGGLMGGWMNQWLDGWIERWTLTTIINLSSLHTFSCSCKPLCVCIKGGTNKRRFDWLTTSRCGIDWLINIAGTRQIQTFGLIVGNSEKLTTWKANLIGEKITPKAIWTELDILEILENGFLSSNEKFTLHKQLTQNKDIALAQLNINM